MHLAISLLNKNYRKNDGRAKEKKYRKGKETVVCLEKKSSLFTGVFRTLAKRTDKVMIQSLPLKNKMGAIERKKRNEGERSRL